MQLQRCPNCREKNDVSFYVHGQQARCTRCGIRFKVDHEAISQPNDARKLTPPKDGTPATEVATHVSSPPAEAAEEIVVSSPSLPSELPQAKPPPKPQITSGQLFPTPQQRQNVPPRPPDPGAAPVPPLIPGYDCLELLGRGGMGEVWRARQHSLNRIVAVKLLSPTLAVEPDFVRRFERESSALAAIAHPNIVTVYDRGSANGYWYFVMEFVDGRSLRDRMDARMARPDLLRLFIQVVKAVDYAHRRGVIHRDLKPENVLLDTTSGLAKVADFGLAGMSEVGRSSLTMTAVAMGTAHYMAPEQRRDAKNVDGRADIYSLGVMLYELLCREIPAGKFATPKERVPDLDPRLDALVMQMLDQDPERRPARASDVVEIIESVLKAPPPAPAPAPVEVVRPPPPPTPPAPKQPLASFVQRVRQNPSQRMMFYGAGGLLAVVLVVTVAKLGGKAQLLPARVERMSGGHATVSFGSGPDDAIAADVSGWKSAESGLVREAAAAAKDEPRAWIQRLPIDFDNALLEADVEVQNPTGKGVPFAELALASEDRQVSVRLALGEDPVATVAYRTPPSATLTRTEGLHDRFQADRKYHLELNVSGGKVTGRIDHRPISAVTLSGFSGLKARAGFGCQVGRCRFSKVALNGVVADTAVSAAGTNERQ